jgi:hypothetical protein
MNNICNNITKFQVSFGILGTSYVGREVPFVPSTKLNNFIRYDEVERKYEWTII